MKIYAIKYRLKGEKAYSSAIFVAENQPELAKKVRAWLKLKSQEEIDKRTLKWVGPSIPVATVNHSEPFIIYADLDNYT